MEDFLTQEISREGRRRKRAARCGWILITRDDGAMPSVKRRRCGVAEYCDYCRERAAANERDRAKRVLEEQDQFYMVVVSSEAEYRALRKRVIRRGGQVRRFPVRENAITVLFNVQGVADRVQTIRSSDEINFEMLVILPEGKNRSGSLGAPPKDEVDLGETVVIQRESYTPRGLSRNQLVSAMDLALLDVAGIDVDMGDRDSVEEFFRVLIHADKSRICDAGGRIAFSQVQNCTVQISRLSHYMEERRKKRTLPAKHFVPVRMDNDAVDDLLGMTDDI